MDRARPAAPRASEEAPKQGFRTDVEGLRAVAIVAVLACHAGIGALAGGYVGVDVFFVISGLLITRLLLGEARRRGSISLSRFYSRRAKRILPLSALVLATVSVLSLCLFSPLRAAEVSGDVVSSALYFVNWHFAAQSVDYFAQGNEPSPVLHLWSLAVEEQFYLVWPALLLGVLWVGRRAGGRERPLAAVAVALVFAGSLAIGIEQTAAQPAAAYFSTFGRAWELALGAALALLGAVRMPRPAAAAIGWAGLAAIVFAVFDFGAGTPFPGLAALVPTLGAAALILAGASPGGGSSLAPSAALSLRPVRYVGRISYSWYLWHWPALVFAAVILGPLSPLAGVAVVLVSLVPTVASHHLVEDPLRHWHALVRARGGLALGSFCMGTAVLAGFLLVALQPSLAELPVSRAQGAEALHLEASPQDHAKALRPSPLNARANVPAPFNQGCMVGTEGTKSDHCVYGDPRGKHTVFLFGDSHALQWFPALQIIARRHRWRLVVLTKGDCTPAEVPILSFRAGGGKFTTCATWRHNSLRRMETERGGHGTVVVSGLTGYTALGRHGQELHGHAGARALQGGYEKTLRRLHGAGLSVLAIRDTPEAPWDVPSCVSEHIHDFRACAFPKPHDQARNFDLRAAHRTGTPLLSLTHEICRHDLCRAVIGSVLVYRDDQHLTASYARTLAPWLEPKLRRLVAKG